MYLRIGYRIKTLHQMLGVRMIDLSRGDICEWKSTCISIISVIYGISSRYSAINILSVLNDVNLVKG